MSKKRMKIVGDEVITRAQAEAIIQNIAHLTLVREDSELAMNENIQSIKKLYEPQIINADQELARLTGIVKTWAENNKEEFEKKKSLETFYAHIGWRTGTPKLKTISKWTWDKVLEAIKAKRRRGYITVKESINKEILISRRKVIGEKRLAAMGLKVVQDEVFFVDVKRETIEPAKMPA